MMWYFTETAADQHDRVLLEVVPDARDVGGDLHLVGQAHARDLAQRRVRLLGRHRAHLETDATLLRGAGNRLLALLQAVPVLAHGRRLDLGDLAGSAVSHELADRWHGDAGPFSRLWWVVAGCAGASDEGGPRGRTRLAVILAGGRRAGRQSTPPRSRARSVSAARNECQTSSGPLPTRSRTTFRGGPTCPCWLPLWRVSAPPRFPSRGTACPGRLLRRLPSRPRPAGRG